VERFAIQLGVSLALARGCSKMVVFSDSKPALETLLNVSVRSGQIFSLDACRALRPWLAEDGEHSIALWHVPARFEWKVQKAAHDSVVHIRISVGPRPRTSRDFLGACSDVQAIKDWHAEFWKPSYRGANFMDLSGSKGKPIFPATHKGGPWLQEAGRELSVCTRLCRSVTGHAPVGAYRCRFHIEGPDKCSCDFRILPPETVEHVVHVCPRHRRKRWRGGSYSVANHCDFLRANPSAIAFNPIIAWDPG
jgi:hypothetical protein